MGSVTEELLRLEFGPLLVVGPRCDHPDLSGRRDVTGPITRPSTDRLIGAGAGARRCLGNRAARRAVGRTGHRPGPDGCRRVRLSRSTRPQPRGGLRPPRPVRGPARQRHPDCRQRVRNDGVGVDDRRNDARSSGMVPLRHRQHGGRNRPPRPLPRTAPPTTAPDELKRPMSNLPSRHIESNMHADQLASADRCLAGRLAPRRPRRCHPARQPGRRRHVRSHRHSSDRPSRS